MLKLYKKLSFSTRVLLWMLVGALLGIFLGERVLFLKPIGEMFLSLLIMGAIPLVFFNLLAGIGAIGSIKALGSTGLKVIIFYFATTAMAITVGLAVMSITKAGAGMELTSEIPDNVGQIPDVWTIVQGMIPENIFKAFAEANLVQIVVFAVLLGIVSLSLPEKGKEQFLSAANFMADIMRRLVEFILKASPLGLGALMAATFAQYGGKIVGSLSIFIGSVYIGQFLMVVFYMILLRIFGKVSPTWFLRKTSELYATTVATCSSIASLAVGLEIAEKKLKLPKQIFSFTLPLGAQFNKDGTSIMLGAVLLFTSQAAGIEFTIGEMIQIVLVGLLISEGSTGIPAGGLVLAMLFAQAFNLPLEIVAIVGGIYRLVDMGNTTVNCMGDMVATAIISKLDHGWKPDQTD